MSTDAGPEVPAIDPEEFAELVQGASDDQLRAGLEANRELLLAEIFRQMPTRLDRERASDIDAVVEWRIADPKTREHDVWQLILRDGSAEVRPGPAEDPTVTMEIGAIDFMRLITGGANGPRLFLFGRLKVRGNLVLAARMPGLFDIPGA
jgi:putative sterol carrier protein